MRSHFWEWSVDQEHKHYGMKVDFLDLLLCNVMPTQHRNQFSTDLLFDVYPQRIWGVGENSAEFPGCLLWILIGIAGNSLEMDNSWKLLKGLVHIKLESGKFKSPLLQNP